MKDRLFIEVETVYEGIKKLVNVDHIVRIESESENGNKYTEISLTTGKYITVAEKYEDLKQRIYDLIQYGMKTDRNIDNT